jgi:hypothetical protein
LVVLNKGGIDVILVSIKYIQVLDYSRRISFNCKNVANLN